jgi:hypothetical protein
MLKLGNTTFICEDLRGWDKEKFIQCYRGVLDGIDISEAFDLIQNELKKNEPKEEIKETKKPRIK